MVILTLVFALIVTRIVECYLFIKRVSKVCYTYDWEFVDANENHLLDIIKKDYHLTNNWSAYNFLYLKGPSPLSIFFSIKPITIEKQYDKAVVDRIKKYAII
jgi:hypothetical protein